MEARLPCTILGVLVVLWAQVAAAMVELDQQKVASPFSLVGLLLHPQPRRLREGGLSWCGELVGTLVPG